MLEVLGLQGGYGGIQVLWDVDLLVGKGEAVALSLIHISEPTRPY